MSISTLPKALHQKHSFVSFSPFRQRSNAIGTVLLQLWDSTHATMGRHSCDYGTVLSSKTKDRKPLYSLEIRKKITQKNLISFISAFPRDKLILRSEGGKEKTTPILQYSVEIMHEKFVTIRVKKINMNYHLLILFHLYN